MYIIILNYWGYDLKSDYYRNQANHSLRRLALANVLRLQKTRTLGEKRMSYRRYFSGYKRVAHYKSYPGLFSKEVQKYIWSFARYCALSFGYDLEELENDWHESIIGDAKW